MGKQETKNHLDLWAENTKAQDTSFSFIFRSIGFSCLNVKIARLYAIHANKRGKTKSIALFQMLIVSWFGKSHIVATVSLFWITVFFNRLS